MIIVKLWQVSMLITFFAMVIGTLRIYRLEELIVGKSNLLERLVVVIKALIVIIIPLVNLFMSFGFAYIATCNDKELIDLLNKNNR